MLPLNNCKYSQKYHRYDAKFDWFEVYFTNNVCFLRFIFSFKRIKEVIGSSENWSFCLVCRFHTRFGDFSPILARLKMKWTSKKGVVKAENKNKVCLSKSYLHRFVIAYLQELQLPLLWIQLHFYSTSYECNKNSIKLMNRFDWNDWLEFLCIRLNLNGKVCTHCQHFHGVLIRSIHF